MAWKARSRLLEGVWRRQITVTGYLYREDREETPMRIGMEQDLIEEFDREFTHAIAVAAQAQFGRGDLREALRQVDQFGKRRLRMNRKMSEF